MGMHGVRLQDLIFVSVINLGGRETEIETEERGEDCSKYCPAPFTVHHHIQ